MTSAWCRRAASRQLIVPAEVGLHHVGRAAVVARVDRRLGRAFEQQIEGARVRQVVWRADVAVHELDAVRAEPVERELAAAALEVVEGADLNVGAVALQHQREAGPDEAGAAGDEDSHEASGNDPRSCGHAMISDAC